MSNKIDVQFKINISIKNIKFEFQKINLSKNYNKLINMI